MNGAEAGIDGADQPSRGNLTCEHPAPRQPRSPALHKGPAEIRPSALVSIHPSKGFSPSPGDSGALPSPAQPSPALAVTGRASSYQPGPRESQSSEGTEPAAPLHVASPPTKLGRAPQSNNVHHSPGRPALCSKGAKSNTTGAPWGFTKKENAGNQGRGCVRADACGSILREACTRLRGTPCVSAPARACAGAGACARDPGCGCEAGVSGACVGVCGVWASVKITCSRGVSRAQRQRKRARDKRSVD